MTAIGETAGCLVPPRRCVRSHPKHSRSALEKHLQRLTNSGVVAADVERSVDSGELELRARRCLGAERAESRSSTGSSSSFGGVERTKKVSKILAIRRSSCSIALAYALTFSSSPPVELGDAHAQQFEIEHGHIQRRLEIVRRVAAATKVRPARSGRARIPSSGRRPRPGSVAIAVPSSPGAVVAPCSPLPANKRPAIKRLSDCSVLPPDPDHRDRLFEPRFDDRELRIVRGEVLQLFLRLRCAPLPRRPGRSR